MLYKCILLRICKNVSFVPQTQFNRSSLFLMNWVLEAVLLQILSSRRICFPNSPSVGIVSPFIYLAWGPIVNKRDLGVVFCPFRKSVFVDLVFKNKNGTVGLTTQDLRSFFTWRHLCCLLALCPHTCCPPNARRSLLSWCSLCQALSVRSVNGSETGRVHG